MKNQFESGCNSLEFCRKHEWLETNNRGEYASSCIGNIHTRKYHSLLTARLPENGGKFSLLSKYEDSLIVNGEKTYLDSNFYPESVYPEGYKHLISFSPLPYPTTQYRVGDTVVTKELQLVKDSCCVLVRYSLKSKAGATIRLRPLLNFRPVHGNAKQNIDLNVRMFTSGSGYKTQPYNDLPALYFHASEPEDFFRSPDWYYNLEFPVEVERGYDGNEDVFSPGVFEFHLKKNGSVIIAAGTDENPGDLKKLWKKCEKGRKASAGNPLEILSNTASSFLVERASEELSVIAGYPWFAEWGRDAMIALPGLTFYAGNREAGIRVLDTFLNHEKDGVIPNFLSESAGEDSYNSIDATLLAFNAVWEAAKFFPEEQIFAKYAEPLNRILGAFTDGTIPFAHVREDGLLYCGSPDSQLTWMDAKVYGTPVTPRYGLPIEVNALWYNALCITLELSKRAGCKFDPQLEVIRDACRKNFQKVFWLEEHGYSADVVNEEGIDTSLRPNQIFAVALPFTVFDAEKAGKILKAVRENLLTPFGLRTLAPSDPGYRGRYHGSQESRDSAYHQGTVWPWLLGHYAAAVVLHSTDRKKELEDLLSYIQPLLSEHLMEYGMLSIAEVFDGDAPYTPGGCISQAWSVAEVIRALNLISEVTE